MESQYGDVLVVCENCGIVYAAHVLFSETLDILGNVGLLRADERLEARHCAVCRYGFYRVLRGPLYVPRPASGGVAPGGTPGGTPGGATPSGAAE